MVINDGRTTPSVANRAPKKPSILLPINVAAFTAMGPGVDSAIAIISSKSSFVAHCFFIYDFTLYQRYHCISSAESESSYFEKCCKQA